MPTELCDQLVTKIMESVLAGLLNLDVVRAASAKLGLYAGNLNSVHNVNTFTYS
jgi:hypothetical protein